VSDGGPAFPEPIVSTPDHGLQSSGSYGFQTGMSLRDYFAAAALQGMMSNSDWCKAARDTTKEQMEFSEAVSRCAYEFADSMLAAREVKS
jgi:hypothetical protein